MGLTPVNVPALAAIVSCAKGSFTAEQLRWLAGEFLRIAEEKEVRDVEVNPDQTSSDQRG